MPPELAPAYLQHVKWFNHVIIQNIHESLLGTGLCNLLSLAHGLGCTNTYRFLDCLSLYSILLSY
jgi:hypothetical protein